MPRTKTALIKPAPPHGALGKIPKGTPSRKSRQISVPLPKIEPPSKSPSKKSER